MPRVPTNAHRILRHYSPLLYRTRFSPERLLTPPPLACRITFPLAEESILPPSESCLSPAVDPVDSGGESDSEDIYAVKIPKPRGEVSRPKRHGYRLRDVVQWDDKTYNRVQVCIYSAEYFSTHSRVFLSVQTYINELAKSHLRLDSTFLKQLQPDLEAVYTAVSVVFPIFVHA